MRSVRAGPDSKRRPGHHTRTPQAHTTSTVTNGRATVTRLADHVANTYRGQWWGDHYLWSWTVAELSRWAS
jgi:hypothetical protein